MKNRLVDYQTWNADAAALLLRLIFGGMFIYFGYGKIEHYNEYIKGMGDPIGLGKNLSYNLVIFAEFACGILIVLGVLTRIAVIPVFITMIVAYFIVHAKDPFMVKQSAFIYLVLCLPVFILGSGKYSIDGLIQRKRVIKSRS